MSIKYILSIALTAALGGLLFGFDTAVISGAIPYLTKEFALDSNELGWAVGAVLMGCALGALLAGISVELWGRKPILIVCAGLFAISGIGVAISNGLFVFIVFRIVGGLGVGAAAMASPMYIAETAPAEKRGKLVSLYQLAIVSGILIAYLSNYLVDLLDPGNWRLMFGLQVVPSIIFLALLTRIPESPRWLVMHSNTQAAKAVLSNLTQDVDKAIENIQGSVFTNYDIAIPGRKKAQWKIWLIGILIAIFQQITGINTILYYAPVIFKETGLSGSSALQQTIIIGIVNVAATFISIGLVDRYGRKKFLIAGSLIMGLMLAVIATCFHYHYYAHYIILISTLIYVAAFGCTLGAVTWVYLSELFPNAIRSIAMSVATLALWLADFAVSYSFPLLSTRMGTAMTLTAYASTCILALLFFSTCLPETKGKSLEEIESLFTK